MAPDFSLINTGLQPGDIARTASSAVSTASGPTDKPLKRLARLFATITGLKSGVNEIVILNKNRILKTRPTWRTITH